MFNKNEETPQTGPRGTFLGARRGTFRPLRALLTLGGSKTVLLYTFQSLIVLSVRVGWQNDCYKTSDSEQKQYREAEAERTIGGEKEVGVVVGSTPFDLVDLFFDLQTLPRVTHTHAHTTLSETREAGEKEERATFK